MSLEPFGFAPIIEGVTRHADISNGLLVPMPHINVLPDAALGIEDRGYGDEAMRVWADAGRSDVRAISVLGVGVGSFDISRALGDGTIIGPSVSDVVRMFEDGVGSPAAVARDAENFKQRIGPALAELQQAARSGRRVIVYSNSEPGWSPDSFGWITQRPDGDEAAIAAGLWGSNRALSVMGRISPWLRTVNPLELNFTNFDVITRWRREFGRVYDMIRLDTHRALLRSVDLDVPGVTLVISNIRYGPTDRFAEVARGVASPGIRQPGTRVGGVRVRADFASNTQNYTPGFDGIGMAEGYLLSCTQGTQVMQHFDCMNSDVLFRKLVHGTTGAGGGAFLYADPGAGLAPGVEPAVDVGYLVGQAAEAVRRFGRFLERGEE